MALFIGSRVKRYLSSLLLIFAESQGIGGTGNNLYLNGTSTTAEGRITRGCSRTAFAAADPPEPRGASVVSHPSSISGRATEGGRWGTLPMPTGRSGSRRRPKTMDLKASFFKPSSASTIN